jgi:hypothetical protein
LARNCGVTCAPTSVMSGIQPNFALVAQVAGAPAIFGRAGVVGASVSWMAGPVRLADSSG